MTRGCAVCGARTVSTPYLLNGYAVARCVRCTHRQATGIAPATQVDLYEPGRYRVDLIEQTRRSLASDFHSVQTFAPFFARVRPRPGARLLDVACGTGRFAFAAMQCGWQAAGVDANATAIGVAREFFPGVRYEVRPVERPMTEGFDAVTAIEFVEHTADPVATLANLLAALRPGGTLYLTVPNWNARAVREANTPEWMPPVHLQFFTHRSLRTLLARDSRIDGRSIRVGFIPPRRLFPLSQWTSNQPEGLFALASSISSMRLPNGSCTNARRAPERSSVS